MGDVAGLTGGGEVAAQYRDSDRLKRRANIHQYGSSPIGWFEWIAREARLPEGAVVLEVGCGPGWLWEQARAAFPAGLRLTLTDLSPGMVEEARQRVGGLPGFVEATFRQADIAALPFPDGAFDAVLACHMLYHVPDIEAALAEMIRVLRPGGLLVVTTNGEDNMGEMYALAAEVFGGLPVDPSGLRFGLDRAAGLLAARLDEVEVSTFSDQLAVPEADDIISTLTSYPPGDSASPAQLADLRRRIDARRAAEGGVFRINKRMGLVRGRRRAT